MATAHKRNSKIRRSDINTAAVPAEALEHPFPKLNLPFQPPYPPAEAKSMKELPEEKGWLYEPKWDGFRCLAFRDGDEIVLQSKAGQPLARYFPELVAALRELPARKFVLDGEIVIRSGHTLDFDALLQRIHPAASRIQRLSQETPSTYMVFDLLIDEQCRKLIEQPLSARRMALQEFANKFFAATGKHGANGKHSLLIELSPAASDFETAKSWMREGAASGWDGVVAKRLDCEYTSGERTGMVKIKRIRTADCVVGGFRWSQKKPGEEVGSLLLGLYNHRGELDHVGFSSSFTREDRKKLKPILKPLIAKTSSGETGFSGKAPGGPSRWATDERSTEWTPLKAQLVGEFQYDHFSGGRFRHGTKFLRWRPEKKPEQCGIDQVKSLAKED